MPELKPFTGVRYSSPSDISDLVCPPYDVISPAQQEALHARHPHNAVRLELAMSGRQAYEGVYDTFLQWLDEGVLQAEEAPSLYVYRQDFVAPGGEQLRVAGVLGALKLEPFGANSGVLPHEQTMAGPKEDRLALMRACPVNVSPIYAIYRGAGKLRAFLDDLESRPPAYGFTDDEGIHHRLWATSAPAEVDLLGDAVSDGPLVIADGHHRYETALAYHAEQRRDGPHDSMMCFCVDADVEDLVVLPYNRAVRTPAPEASIRSRLIESFEGKDVDVGEADALLARSTDDHPFVFRFRDSAVLAHVTDDQVIAGVGDRHPAWRSLDVVALHEVLLPAVAPDGLDDVRFAREPAEIARLVEEEGFSIGVLLRALDAPRIVDAAQSAERMPQKASYFWPKAITGLVFRPLRTRLAPEGTPQPDSVGGEPRPAPTPPS
jgi:uncharacterized protein (DUF1015 family)